MNFLKQLPIWVCWKYAERDGKQTKIPINPQTGGNAQSNNPATWATYEQATAAAEKHKYNGVGFMFSDGICGIDMDNVIGNPELEALVKEIIYLMNTYTEVSPSGNGYHIIFRCDDLSKIPKVSGKLDPVYYQKNPLNGVECYISGLTNRYFTYTGNATNDIDIEDRTEQLLIILDKYMKKKENPPASVTNVTAGGYKPHHAPTVHDIISIAQKNKNSKNFLDLFKNGDTSKYGGDHSRADMALCCILAFYCGNNPALIDTIFRQSKLYRDDKWEREDYRTRTIEKAISLQNGKFYDWTKPKKNTSKPSNISQFDETQYDGAIYRNPFSPTSEQRYEMNDIGAGNFFADTYMNTSRYVREKKLWHIYDGRVWRSDESNLKVAEQAKHFTSYLHDCQKYINDDKHLEAWLKFVRWRKRKKARDIMLEDAKSVHPISIMDFDKSPYILNCQNCTLDLQNFTTRKHTPDDLLSKISNVIYNPNAKCERWEQFINEIMCGDETRAKFLQKALGYALTGDTSMECFFILYGATARNGKGTTMETMRYLMGDYGRNTQPETIMKKQYNNGGAPSEDMARLNGAHFINVSEPAKGQNLNSALVKQMTGGDTVTARFLYQESFEYKPKFKLFINTNHLPRVSDDSIFASGRVKLIPFERHFSESEQDNGLKELFRQPDNLSGILNWLIEGLKLMRSEGLEQSQAVKDAITEYREESDVVGRFVRERIIKKGKCKTLMSEIYLAYTTWCEHNGNNSLNKNNLISELRTKGMTIKNSTGNKLYLFDYRMDDYVNKRKKYTNAKKVTNSTVSTEDINMSSLDWDNCEI